MHNKVLRKRAGSLGRDEKGLHRSKKASTQEKSREPPHAGRIATTTNRDIGSMSTSCAKSYRDIACQKH